MINIKALFKSERGLRKEKVKVTRGGKTFYREQMVGRKEVEKKAEEKIKEIDITDMNTRIKCTKNIHGLYITVNKKRVHIPHRDMLLFRETVIGSLEYNSTPKMNFKDFQIQITPKTDNISIVTIWKNKKSYSGSVLAITLLRL